MTIELQNINKSFGDVHANQNISMTFKNGRIIGVLGENGAGKSTLMKILCGYQPADSGTILINDEPASYHSPEAAIAAGIGMLQQDPLDVAAFSVIENYIYGTQRSASLLRRLFYSKSRAERDFNMVSKTLGFDLPMHAQISELSIAQRQQLEIVRLVTENVQTLILDEPTTGISAEQKEQLFNTLKTLASEGMIILLVSHKLEDVIALCDEVVVLRAGQFVGQRTMPAEKQALVELMFGKDLPPIKREHRALSEKNPPLSINNAHIIDGRLQIENLSMNVRRGEVIGIAGLDGSGQELIMRAMAGLASLDSGQLTVNGKDVTNQHYHNLLDAGVMFAASGRLEEGLIAGLTLTEHVALMEERELLVDWRDAKKRTNGKIADFSVKGKASDPIEALSGGNQQRLLLSLLPLDAQVLILEQPMRGLDVDSAAGIWEKLLARVDNGTSIIFSSADLDEILTYSDRIVVCYAGRIKIINDPSTIDQNALGHYIGGEFLDD